MFGEKNTSVKPPFQKIYTYIIYYNICEYNIYIYIYYCVCLIHIRQIHPSLCSLITWSCVGATSPPTSCADAVHHTIDTAHGDGPRFSITAHGFVSPQIYYTPEERKKNMEPQKMKVWKMFFLFKLVIFRFHVSFRGCSHDNVSFPCYSTARSGAIPGEDAFHFHKIQHSRSTCPITSRAAVAREAYRCRTSIHARHARDARLVAFSSSSCQKLPIKW